MQLYFGERLKKGVPHAPLRSERVEDSRTQPKICIAKREKQKHSGSTSHTNLKATFVVDFPPIPPATGRKAYSDRAQPLGERGS